MGNSEIIKQILANSEFVKRVWSSAVPIAVSDMSGEKDLVLKVSGAEGKTVEITRIKADGRKKTETKNVSESGELSLDGIKNSITTCIISLK